jgi:glycerophosphoryl diester phosphodiesterase
VSTLELDVQITEDASAVVTHDHRVAATKCVGARGAGDGYETQRRHAAGCSAAGRVRRFGGQITPILMGYRNRRG